MWESPCPSLSYGGIFITKLEYRAIVAPDFHFYAGFRIDRQSEPYVQGYLTGHEGERIPDNPFRKKRASVEEEVCYWHGRLDGIFFAWHTPRDKSDFWWGIHDGRMHALLGHPTEDAAPFVPDTLRDREVPETGVEDGEPTS